MSELPSIERIVERLSGPESAARTELAEHIVQHVFSQKLSELVAFDAFLPIVLATLTRENLAREFQRSVQPGVARYSAEIASAPERVGDLLSAETVDALRKQLEQPTGARGRWAKGAVDPALLKRLLGPVWVQLLVNFARRIPGLGGSSAPGASSAPKSGIASMLGRSVQQVASAGKSALEGLGIDVEKKLLAAARDFSDGALSVWNQALRERTTSPEGASIVTQIKHGVLSHVLATRLSEIDRDAVALPLAAYLDLVPQIVGHAVQLPFVRHIIERELQAYLAVSGERRVDALLTELGVLDASRAWLIARVETQLRGYCESPAFAAWIAKLLAP